MGRYAAQHDGDTGQCGQGIVHKDQGCDDNAANDKDDWGGGEPPATNALGHAEECGGRERKKQHRREDDVGEHAVKRAEQKDGQRKNGLEKNCVGWRAKARMYFAKSGKKRA